jgi:hypothetical protein
MQDPDSVHSAVPAGEAVQRPVVEGSGNGAAKATERVLHASSECPICGYDKPHGHDAATVEAYRSDQIRRDGWISTAVRLPQGGPAVADRYFLCRGHRLQVPKDADYNNIHYLSYQRMSEHAGYPAEVLEFDATRGFYLLHRAGNAKMSGAEGRTPVYVSPTHWMPLPQFGEHSDALDCAARLSGAERLIAHLKNKVRSLQREVEALEEKRVREQP